MQPNLKNPSKIPIYRKKFWRDFNKYGFLYCSPKWPVIVEFPSVLKTKIRRIVRNKIKLLKIIRNSLSYKH